MIIAPIAACQDAARLSLAAVTISAYDPAPGSGRTVPVAVAGLPDEPLAVMDDRDA